VKASPRVIAEGQPVPKGGGRAMVGKPYVVGSKTYVPQEGRGYVREGWASWYGEAFHGRLTANGEVFDRQSVAAAHPTLPLPSYVRVTNILNKRSMVLRVNDRGPYEAGRIIDVSERAAVALDFRRAGTSRVKVEYLGKASIGGSDDAKLLATLRTDGLPAAIGQSRTMVADLREPAIPSRPVVRLASLTPKVQAIEDAESDDTVAVNRPNLSDTPARSQRLAELEAPRERSVPAQALDRSQTVLASAAPVPPQRPMNSVQPRAGALSDEITRSVPRVELLPPERPVLAGIY
jgi:rare lipoprotein A